ncbi:hypothetical protein [Spiroplasma tabanidicola]|uniref:Uncharacterized protein n=1 Tax=Spiroplasma tabanidicola TaxID=324079 RepID=A0A6I6CB68_9MOLU|nr:hypothetical protein [Spiroplasma tabanidicola]QGS51418.1 hypothetical protein STABA_v1c00510 [Spiroplasma tabanidicola]
MAYSNNEDQKISLSKIENDTSLTPMDNEDSNVLNDALSYIKTNLKVKNIEENDFIYEFRKASPIQNGYISIIANDSSSIIKGKVIFKVIFKVNRTNIASLGWNILGPEANDFASLTGKAIDFIKLKNKNAILGIDYDFDEFKSYMPTSNGKPGELLVYAIESSLIFNGSLNVKIKYNGELAKLNQLKGDLQSVKVGEQVSFDVEIINGDNRTYLFGDVVKETGECIDNKIKIIQY